MAGIRKLRAVRALVRPDLREDYLERWKGYSEAAKAAGAEVWLFEDQLLPGRFLEFTEHIAAEGMEDTLAVAFREAGLTGPCVRRVGDDILYREVVLEER